MVSVDTYQLWDKQLPAALTALVWLLTVIVVVIGIVLKRIAGNDDKKVVPHIFLETMKDYFPTINTAKCSKDKSKRESSNPEVEVDDVKISKTWFSVMTVLLVPLIVSTMFITFWNVYWIEESVGGDCEPNFDCFPIRDGDFLQRDPVSSCSSFEVDLTNSSSGIVSEFADGSSINGTLFESNDTNATNMMLPSTADREVKYECYRFVFNYVDAFGAIGGLLVFAALVSKLYFGLLVTVYNVVTDDDYYWVRDILYAVICGLAGLFFLGFVIVHTAPHFVNKAVFQSTTDLIEFIMYSITFFATFVSGIIVVIAIEVKNR